MRNKYVLLVDNDPDYLNTCAEFLELAHYVVYKVSTPAEALLFLQSHWVHIAILDLRLGDESEGDRSGLTLARQIGPRIPKLILTRFPTQKDTRQALVLPAPDKLPLAIDFVDKHDGLENLSLSIENAFDKYLGINWGLQIVPNPDNPIPVSLNNLVSILIPDQENFQVRAEELENLFQKLFKEKNQIIVKRLLWQERGLFAVIVCAFQDGTSETFVVVCGLQTVINQLFDSNGTVRKNHKETTHFIAYAYTLVGSDLDLDNIDTLAERFRLGQDKIYNAALANLYEGVLHDWHQEKRSLEDTKTLDRLYQEQLFLTPEILSSVTFAEHVKFIIRQLPTLGIYAEIKGGKIILQIGQREFSYPDPTNITDNLIDTGHPVVVVNSPGVLSAKNILTDDIGKVWLTNFAKTGPVPLLWNYVLLEAEVRFDHVDTKDIRQLYEIEQCLVADNFSKPDTRNIEITLRKPIKIIQRIRELASRTIGKYYLPYHLGILYCAARRIADFDPSMPLLSNKLARLAHALIAIAMVKQKIQRQYLSPTFSTHSLGIFIDHENRAVYVEGQIIDTTPQEFKILACLSERPSQLCTNQVIFKSAFGREYVIEEDYLLKTAISRLRNKIEPDKSHPRYLFNKRGVGYCLKLNRLEEE